MSWMEFGWKKKETAAIRRGGTKKTDRPARGRNVQSLSDRGSVSEKAPLQDRFSERVRAWRTGIPFGNRCLVLAEKWAALVSRIRDRKEDADNAKEKLGEAGVDSALVRVQK